MNKPAPGNPGTAALCVVPSRTHDASPPGATVPVTTVSGFGAELRRLRLAARLGTRRLAERSALSRKSIQYFEAGVMRPRRCTIGAVAYGLDPDSPEHRREIIDRLVVAAGGADALAADGNWPRYRSRRFTRGLLDGSVPFPADLAQRMAALRQASALRRQADALLERPGALDDLRALDRAIALLDESRRQQEIGGGMITVYLGGRRIHLGGY